MAIIYFCHRPSSSRLDVRRLTNEHGLYEAVFRQLFRL